ncbi:MAG: hypothetical protein ACD_41C00114G0003 [uncultured bacterium]|nr:MAG: hypothetical protein ACD_41C00114G0003 [uncultured bacterium]
MKSKDIQAVYRRGVKTYHPLFRLFVRRTNRPTNQFTVVVSKRVSKKAVERNRIKRRLRPIVRKKLSSRSGYDVVVVAQPKAKDATSQQLEQVLQL